MYPFFYDSSIIYLIPAIIFAMYAQSKVRSSFAKYLKIGTQKGYTGYDVARTLLDKNGLRDVPVELVKGHLSDHYDPRSKKLRLSKDVYQRSSIASVSVAAHEVGHAIQHSQGYLPLTIRGALVPLANFGSKAAWIFVLGGFFLQSLQLIDLGILLYGAAVLFTVITLPVEFNASSRAMTLLDEYGFITREEYAPAKKVLNAAALTYLAAMATALAQLFRLIVLRNSRRD
ncbi:zinc metallopeptidase [Alkaliphilus hydrothermalis]|uniref:Zn-dependent membrane protease YugP n=1 Tax=Alkaliphilus hydrothermalis TaxID=1482730 RepID=A0ABS2NNI8_9FIRM|nr:zinc metallopeptidase [Alkaliphilus hydrothermalis]MBM7614510.1 Zn-dependent membrane protease YugP [Alkaliphilus hydrothermalis]